MNYKLWQSSESLLVQTAEPEELIGNDIHMKLGLAEYFLHAIALLLLV